MPKDQAISIDKVIATLNDPRLAAIDKVQRTLELCSKRVAVEFALEVCLGVEHLMKDKRSQAIIPMLREVLAGPCSRERVSSVREATYAAAYAANAAAAHAAAAAAYAAAADTANAAAYAAYATAAAYAAANAGSISYDEAAQEYLVKLKEIILRALPSDQRSFLLDIAL